MYAWHFPKGFWQYYSARWHDWANVVVWIDNPELETPKILGLSTSHGDNKYGKIALAPGFAIDGTSPKFYHTPEVLAGQPFMDYTYMALNTTDFGNAKVPFIDEYFNEKLKKAWPF
ncbi:hypothetical protein BBO99_00007338 [Phytophthora kernoviae]|uniref:Necrosis inducing protein NPP1 type n=2 Tax=Phytophthora kernoviae TaxID=325452 RepID=A0A421FJU4_9STRA|nr:hypothetical protein G195_009544 [Phytophthora kernoviae 00238/432]KAG2519485.1 hypothetical protein JM16_007064 [Phytophthora kernoviae]KAG2520579.1 hypothetical protein JM18_006923 [Phytophthora kernoviae]RLN46113.1 hypothetical protein BBI17_007254 [Phytophthora kernoviae]RLN76715.1 hypothetical protein BBO99_00007338 [Phytophthora kernoviae]